MSSNKSPGTQRRYDGRKQGNEQNSEKQGGQGGSKARTASRTDSSAAVPNAAAASLRCALTSPWQHEGP